MSHVTTKWLLEDIPFYLEQLKRFDINIVYCVVNHLFLSIKSVLFSSTLFARKLLCMRVAFMNLQAV